MIQCVQLESKRDVDDADCEYHHYDDNDDGSTACDNTSSWDLGCSLLLVDSKRILPDHAPLFVKKTEFAGWLRFCHKLAALNKRRLQRDPEIWAFVTCI